MANDNAIELRCPAPRERNGEMVTCNAKLCEKHGGNYRVQSGKLAVTMIMGNITCRKCGRVQVIPPSPVEDQKPIIKEKEHE